MSTSSSQSLRSREFGNRSALAGVKNPGQMEENDVFLTASDNMPSIVGKNILQNGGPRKVQALSDSSNSLKKPKSGLGFGGSNKNSFGFKKPIPLSSTIKLKSSRGIVGKDNNSSAQLIRSNSEPTPVTTLGKSSSEDKQNMKQKNEDLNSFYDLYDQFYPEPEFLRDISIQDLKEYVITSPIEIGLDDEEFQPRDDDNNDSSVITDEEDEVDLDQDCYPEPEKLPGNYETQILMDDPVWIKTCDMNVSYETDYPTISEPPCLEYDLESDLAFMTDYLSSLMLESSENIPGSGDDQEDSFDEGVATIR